MTQFNRFFITLFNKDSDKIDLKFVNDFKDFLKLHKLRYCFQIEECPTSKRHHVQGRLGYNNQKRISEAMIPFKDSEYAHIYLRPEYNAKKSQMYVTKIETRILGPWADTDPETIIPKQIQNIELYPWQKRLVNISQEFNTRTIHVIYDDNGNIGKSTITTFMGVHGYAKQIPFINDYKDLMRISYDVGEAKCYIIDMPRAVNKDKLFQLYGGIETLKSGYCFDDRNKFRQRYFDCPAILVFTNHLPDQDLLSRDRWCIWRVDDEKILIPYEQDYEETEEEYSD